MRSIPWTRVVKALKQGDVGTLRGIADQAADDQHHRLLGVLAEIVSSRPNGSQSLQRIVARLVDDSFEARHAAGARNTLSKARYEAGPFQIEIQLEHAPDAPRIALSGHIAARNRPAHGMGEVPVLLVSSRKVIARAVADPNGNFRLECAPTRAPHLHLALKEHGKAIELRLGGLLSRFLVACYKHGSDHARSPRRKATSP